MFSDIERSECSYNVESRAKAMRWTTDIMLGLNLLILGITIIFLLTRRKVLTWHMIIGASIIYNAALLVGIDFLYKAINFDLIKQFLRYPRATLQSDQIWNKFANEFNDDFIIFQVAEIFFWFGSLFFIMITQYIKNGFDIALHMIVENKSKGEDYYAIKRRHCRVGLIVAAVALVPFIISPMSLLIWRPTEINTRNDLSIASCSG